MKLPRAARRLVAVAIASGVLFIACGGNDGNRPPIALPTTTERTTTTGGATTTTEAPTTTTTLVPSTTTTIGGEGSTTTTLAPPHVSSTSVGPGGSIVLTDGGWQPDSTVDLSLHSTPVSLGTATTGDDGSFSKTITIPANTTAGAHTIEITGTDANQQTATHSVEINVVTSTGSTVTTVHTGGSTLPFTGSSTIPLVFFALTLVGGGLAMAARRRRAQA